MNGLQPPQVTKKGINIPQNIKLYSRNSHKHIRLRMSGVDGKGLRTDSDAQLVLESVGFGGQVQIKSSSGKRYLCVAGHGAFIVKFFKNQSQAHIDHCIFIQGHYNGYTVYRTKVHKDWYLGIKNDGRLKSAKKTSITQRATHFIEI
ncbi:fibroblast growth factor 17 [Exaiptasia diaphana]|uniref:Fibroblast growth factor n=1 Tax=Exaiptasia diaphana TaxID=2652724 RepID=A0A913Y5V6_EXADI|nr:fibroblast growth factor 17 [Exaiptasia diaphana]